MGLNLRQSKKWQNFNFGVSYRLGESRQDRFFDALNCYSDQNLLRTRHGIRLYNTTGGGGQILSMSTFKKSDGTLAILAKIGTVIYSVPTSGAWTSLKTGLSAATKHRGVTLNDRHIISVEEDGLFFYDGTNFSSLGQAGPAGFSVAAAAGGSLTATTWRVKLTFYASSIGFETNGSAASSTVATSGGNLSIDITSSPTTATHPLIDKVRVYLKDVTADSEYLFHSEINLSTASLNVTTDPDSSQIPPTTHAAPPSGGATYITEFNGGIAYTGRDSFESDVYIGEQYLPDCVDDSGGGIRVFVPGDGETTGIATGFYNENQLQPYLVITKERSTHIFDPLNNFFNTISNTIGCVSGETMKVINGDVHFMSHSGWRRVSNGNFVIDEKGRPVTLAGSDLDDIFGTPGYVYELNRGDWSNFFSVYYGTLDQYITVISEGSSTQKIRAYCYENKYNSFKPYSLPTDMTSGAVFTDSTGNETVLFGSKSGFVYKHNIKQKRTDENDAGAEIDIEANCLLPWMPVNDDADFDASYIAREFMIDAITNANTIECDLYKDFVSTDPTNYDLTFPDPGSGFVLDVSVLDEDSFSDTRTRVRARADLNETGKSFLIKISQSETDSDMALISGQLDIRKMGNPN